MWVQDIFMWLKSLPIFSRRFAPNIKDFVFIVIGVICASIGLKGFLLPNNFLDGGAMGVSLLLQIQTGLDLSLLIVLVNLPFILIPDTEKKVLEAFGVSTIAGLSTRQAFLIKDGKIVWHDASASTDKQAQDVLKQL